MKYKNIFKFDILILSFPNFNALNEFFNKFFSFELIEVI